MISSAIVALIVGILTAVAGAGVGIASAVSNKKAVEDTNETNYKIAQETNQSNVEQANLAYQRSLPLNQINNLMSAGLSKQGALNHLAGGGSYTAPTLSSAQMQAPHIDLSQVGSSLERLNSIPVNVEQSKMISTQRNALMIDTQNKINADKRAREMHEYDLWSKQYGKESATALDSASTLVANALIDSGKDINDFKSFDDMIHQLGLSKSSILRQMPHSARVQLEESVRSKFAESRSQQEQENQNTAAMDAHLTSALNREDMRKRINDYDSENNARKKEYKLRELQAEVNSILAQDGLSLAEYEHNLEFNEDGSVKFSRKVSERAKRAWDRLSDTIGIGVLRDLVRGVVTIAK